ncbi:MAG: hypothetical protein ABFD96_03320 [Armatimonadia bacterium]
MDRKGFAVTCPICKKEWMRAEAPGWVFKCPDCALAELQEECQKQHDAEAQLAADEREERLTEGDGCVEAVIPVIGAVSFLVWGLIRLWWC